MRKSKIIELVKEDVRAGVILDSPDEFENALRQYAAGIENKIAQNWTEDDVIKPKDPRVLESQTFATLFAAQLKQETDAYIQKSIAKMKEDLVREGRCEKRFDHDAGGSRFYKTTVKGYKVDDKYVLRTCAAHVGNKPELDLAEFLGKPVGISTCSVVCKLSIDKDARYLIDLDTLLKPLGRLFDLKEVLSKMRMFRRPDLSEIEFNHNGKVYCIETSTNAPNSTIDYGCAIRVQGSALSTVEKWNDKEQKLEDIDVILQPYITIDVNPTQEFEVPERDERVIKWRKEQGDTNPSIRVVRGRRYYSLVKPEEIKQMQEARDCVYNILNAAQSKRKK